MANCLAFVLGGGGARGAMQVGALRALFEAGYKPDLLVGVSIGAVNATGLGLWGVNLDGVKALERTYQRVAEAHLMDPRQVRLSFRGLSARPNRHAKQRVLEFFINAGIKPELRFRQIVNTQLGLVGADLNSGQPVIYGQHPEGFVLEGLMASIALPPWFAPIYEDGRFIVDGGAISNLPIEPALTLGATEIIALDLNDPTLPPGKMTSLNQYLGKLVFAISQRHIYLETSLAVAQGVPVHCMQLRSSPPIQIWDFKNSKALIEIGYDIASQEISGWKNTGRTEIAQPVLLNVY